jgi:multidrug efflux system membrane fusion protein
MLASLLTFAPKPRPSLAIPASAIVRPPGRTEGFAVFVLDGDVLRVRSIEPGLPCAHHVEVTAGLDERDQVITEGASQSFDGERVTLIP